MKPNFESNVEQLVIVFLQSHSFAGLFAETDEGGNKSEGSKLDDTPTGNI
jgi:hypothetical protein